MPHVRLVELTKELQGLCGQLATMIGIELVELAPSLRCASNFDYALLEERLVADVVVSHELARPVAEERARMMAATTLGEAIHDDRLWFVLGGTVTPQVCPMRPP